MVDQLKTKKPVMSDIHGGLSCEAAEEDRYGLGAGYAELPGLRQRIAELTVERDTLDKTLRWAQNDLAELGRENARLVEALRGTLDHHGHEFGGEQMACVCGADWPCREYAEIVALLAEPGAQAAAASVRERHRVSLDLLADYDRGAAVVVKTAEMAALREIESITRDALGKGLCDRWPRTGERIADVLVRLDAARNGGV